jgi:hypothetical protein
MYKLSLYILFIIVILSFLHTTSVYSYPVGSCDIESKYLFLILKNNLFVNTHVFLFFFSYFFFFFFFIKDCEDEMAERDYSSDPW